MCTVFTKKDAIFQMIFKINRMNIIKLGNLTDCIDGKLVLYVFKIKII